MQRKARATKTTREKTKHAMIKRKCLERDPGQGAAGSICRRISEVYLDF